MKEKAKKKKRWFRKREPEVGGLVLPLVEKRFLDVISGVELGRFLRQILGGRLGIVSGKNAIVFGLDSPKASLMVHLRPWILAHAPNQIRVTALSGVSHLGRHFWSLTAETHGLKLVVATWGRQNPTLLLSALFVKHHKPSYENITSLLSP